MALTNIQTVPIAELNPGLEGADERSILGVVTLVWPYASSKECMSLLLVEPDFRLRARRGQVRLSFNGASAKAISRAGVCSGDTLLLHLKGVTWAKDGSAGATPGRSIEWELQFGEFAQLEVQRPSDEPMSIHVDHPPPSPRVLSGRATPRRLSPDDSHNLTSTHKSQFGSLSGVHTWSSPAFLKQANFLASSYDPFAEAEEEFPDNNRQKKSRFGRGSRQWRFTERTPSPIKEPTEAKACQLETPSRLQAAELAIVSPSITPEIDPQGPQKSEQGFSLEGGDNGQNGAANDELETIATAETKDLAPALNGHTIEESNNEHESFLATESKRKQIDVEDIVEQPRLSTGGITGHIRESGTAQLVIPSASSHNGPVVLSEKLSVPASVISIGSSSSPSSTSDEQSEEEEASEADHGEDFVYTGPSSDLGMDGSVFSKPHDDFSKQIVNNNTASSIHFNETITREDTSLDLVHLRKEDIDMEMPDAGLEVVGAPQNDLDMTIEQQAGQERSSMPLPASDRLDSIPLPASSVSGTDDPPATNGTFVQDTLADAGAYLKMKDPQDLSVSRSTASKELESEDEHVNEHDGAEATSSRFDEREGDQNGAQIARKPTHASSVDLIDLESDEDDGRQRIHSLHSSLQTSVSELAEDIRKPNRYKTGPDDPRRDKEDDDLALGTSGLVVAEDDKSSAPQDRGGPGGDPDGVQKAVSTVLVENETKDIGRGHEASRIADMTKEAKASTRSATDVRRASSAEGQQATNEKTQPSADLPATVQDSVKAAPREPLLTPNSTQQNSFVSHSSISAIQSVLDDETLPTPRLTQGTSTDIIALDSPTVEGSSHVAPKGILRSDISLQPSQEERPLSSPLPNPPLTPPKRHSALVEKLKAKGALARRSPNTRLSVGTSAVSPWFAPRRSSQGVPDSEAETGVSGLESERRTAAMGIVSGTRETPEKLLSKMFIRSPPERKDMESVVSSSQYSTPSQLATGGLRTNLAYFVPLTALSSHFGTLTDVLAIAIGATTITRASSGPRDHCQSVYITDPSSSKTTNSVTTAQIFRPNETCFPEINSGDAILLRNFKVQSFEKRPSLLSTEISAWAVFRPDTDVQVRGPPVEYGAEERGFARGTWTWWGSISDIERSRLKAAVPEAKPLQPNSQPKSKKASINGIGVNLPSSRGPKTQPKHSDQHSTQALAREWSTRLDDPSSLTDEAPNDNDDKKPPTRRRGLRSSKTKGKPVSDSSSPEKEDPQQRRQQRKKATKALEHELRDGTRYVDGEEAPDGEEQGELRLHELRDGRKYRDRR